MEDIQRFEGTEETKLQGRVLSFRVDEVAKKKIKKEGPNRDSNAGPLAVRDFMFRVDPKRVSYQLDHPGRICWDALVIKLYNK